MSVDMLASGPTRVLFLLFLLSGFSALTYQVVWLRLAFAAFGIITPVMSVLVSVFMLGLALGSWGAGRWVRAWSRRSGASAIYFYALAEAVIGASAFAVPPLFAAGQRWLLPFEGLDSPTYLLCSAVLLGASILPWCVAMGSTFPLMMAFVKEVDRRERNSFSFLYLANVLGAMAGTLFTVVVLIELLGFRATLYTAAAANFSIAAVASVLGARQSARRVRTTPTRVEPDRLPAARTPLDPPTSAPSSSRSRRTLAILFSTGFCSMGSEVIWARSFSPNLGNLVYSFSLLLAVYLFATWAGSWLLRRHVDRGRVGSTANLIAGLAVACWLPVVVNDPRLRIHAVELLLSIFPFCALLGYLTPKLVDQFSEGQPEGGGRAYAVNVLGSILGPLFASYVLLPTVGARYGLVLLNLPFLLLLGAFRRSRGLAARLGAPAAVAAAMLGFCALFVSSSYDEGWPGFEGEIRRDYTATVISWGSGMRKQITVNGVGQSAMTPITKVMAHLPLALLERPPENALVICFGMGTTFRSLLSWGVETTAVELVPSVPEAFAYYHADAQRVASDPRGRIVIDDGRRFLQRVDHEFDVITIDPSPPTESAGSSLLYSREFYRTVRSRLAEDGILMHWLPPAETLTLQAVTRSLVDSFPYVRVLRGFGGEGHHFVASTWPIDVPSPAELVARIPEAARQDLVEWNAGSLRDARTFLRVVLGMEVDARELLNPDPRVAISDDQPFNEYYLLRRTFADLWKP